MSTSAKHYGARQNCWSLISFTQVQTCPLPFRSAQTALPYQFSSLMAPPPTLPIVAPPPLEPSPASSPPPPPPSTTIAPFPARWGAFSDDALRAPGTAHTYVPSAHDAQVHAVITREPSTRLLVRALTQAPNSPARGGQLPQAQASTLGGRKRARDDTPVPLDALPKKAKQRCLRVALQAAAAAPGAHPQLVAMREQWLKNPRARFKLTKDLHRALALTVHTWNLETLNRYADAADLSPNANTNANTRASLVEAVRSHLAPNATIDSSRRDKRAPIPVSRPRTPAHTTARATTAGTGTGAGFDGGVIPNRRPPSASGQPARRAPPNANRTPNNPVRGTSGLVVPRGAPRARVPVPVVPSTQASCSSKKVL